ncbi:MAG TPA: OsmC family protein, partial [Solirubrobacterales bacterium]|nr:OsmC family protein [Solirubrobacterales bacterium]
METTIHRAGVSWTGGEGEDVQAHEVLLGAQTLPSSSALELGGDEVKSNPETLLIGALASCHMLWFLSLARKKGFEIASYEDDADGVLDGKRSTTARTSSASSPARSTSRSRWSHRERAAAQRRQCPRPDPAPTGWLLLASAGRPRRRG